MLDGGKPSSTGNLMSSLVRASKVEQMKKIKSNADGARGITVDEILGNIH